MLKLDSVHRSWHSVVLRCPSLSFVVLDGFGNLAARDTFQDSVEGEGEQEVLFTLNPKKKVALPLAEKVVLTENSCRFRFSLPSEEHRLGLPIGKVRVPTDRLLA